MNRRRLHFAWFIHQPYFIPDEEVQWRIDSTYIPLLDAFRERSIRISLGITGGLLERCVSLRPAFVDEILKAAQDGAIMLLGSAADHPVLPWLSINSARAHLSHDRAIKEKCGFARSEVLWPPELAWSTRVGLLAAEAGYSSVVVDSSVRDSAEAIPQWRREVSGLRPVADISVPVGTSPKVTLSLGNDEGDQELTLWVRERTLSDALLQAVRSEQADTTPQFPQFVSVLDDARSRSIDPARPLLLADDPERYLPNGLGRMLEILDSALDASVDFVSPGEFLALPACRHIAYAPASTMEGSDALWSATFDDRCYREYLERVTAQVEQKLNLLAPQSEAERTIRRRLMRLQDSGFYFWHFVARSRRPFYADLFAIERWLVGNPPHASP